MLDFVVATKRDAVGGKWKPIFAPTRWNVTWWTPELIAGFFCCLTILLKLCWHRLTLTVNYFLDIRKFTAWLY